MPNFDAQSLVSWIHFIMLALAGGCMPVCIMLSGFEDTHEDIRGLSAVIWKKVARWGMRFAVIAGAAILVMQIIKGGKPFSQPHLMFKMGIAPILLLLCETTPKQLATGKRGAAMLAMVIFLVTSFVASNGRAFFEAKPEASIAAPSTSDDLPALSPMVTAPASDAAPAPASAETPGESTATRPPQE